MPIDLAALATTLVGSFLMPYAKKGLTAIGAELKEAAGKTVVDGVQKVWSKVRPLFIEDVKDKSTWEDFEEMPEAAKDLVKAKLEKKLAQHPKLAQELSDIVNAPVSSGGATLQNVMAENFGFIDARGAQISGGNVTAVKVSSHATPRHPSTPPKSGS